MFQNRMKRRAVSGRLFVLPAIVVALLLAASTVFAFSTVQAQGTTQAITVWKASSSTGKSNRWADGL